MKLQDKIDESCLTLKEIADQANITTATIHRLLKGYPAHRRTWSKIAKFFKCKVEDIKE